MFFLLQNKTETSSGISGTRSIHSRIVFPKTVTRKPTNGGGGGGWGGWRGVGGIQLRNHLSWRIFLTLFCIIFYFLDGYRYIWTRGAQNWSLSLSTTRKKSSFSQHRPFGQFTILFGAKRRRNFGPFWQGLWWISISWPFVRDSYRRREAPPKFWPVLSDFRPVFGAPPAPRGPGGGGGPGPPNSNKGGGALRPPPERNLCIYMW